jgi:hypothetical protein
MLFSHLAMPRQGHLQEAFHIHMMFDPTYPTIDKTRFKEECN